MIQRTHTLQKHLDLVLLHYLLPEGEPVELKRSHKGTHKSLYRIDGEEVSHRVGHSNNAHQRS